MSTSLFAAVEMAPRDPILGLNEAFNAETNPNKVNLGVGVYFGDDGKIPLLAAVKSAEATRLATRRLTESDRRALTKIHTASRKHAESGNVKAYSDANAQFHEAIYAGACNEFLGQQIKEARTRLAPILLATLYQAGRLADSWKEHDRILAAINAGDDRAARDAMSSHSTIGGTLFADIVARLAAERAP